VTDPATRDRISGVLNAFAQRAWNPTAPPVRPSRQQGGLFINYRPTFDGSSHPDAQTNVNTNGLSDAQAGKQSRHDPLTDLALLRDLDAASAGGIRSPATDRLRCRLVPVTAAEFTDYGPPRGSVYSQLADLSQLDPAGPWRADAHRFAATLAKTFGDPTTLGATAARPQVRPDWVAESAEALVDAGSRFTTPAWTSLGERLADQLAATAADPGTGLFPDLVEVHSSGAVTVADPLVRTGAEAQLLDSLLVVADRTGNGQVRSAAAAALMAMESPGIGLVDTGHGGWFFGVDADGTGPRTAYKETRSAWMVPLLRHAVRDGLPVPAGAPAQAERLVRDSMYLASSQGYVYRLAPDWTVYSDRQQGSTLAENWVSSEATGIAVDVLLGDLHSVS
jgi:hypothetical protein